MAQPKGTAKTTTDPKPILKLSTLDRVENVDIDGKLYPFVNLDAMSLRQRLPVADALQTCITLMQASVDSSKPFSKAKERGLSKALLALVPLLLPALPAAKLKELNDIQQQDIIAAFLVVRSERAGSAGIVQRMMAGQLPIGEKSSPASNGTTAAKPNRGTRRSRQRSSGRSPS